jgi:hypothetical protein
MQGDRGGGSGSVCAACLGESHGGALPAAAPGRAATAPAAVLLRPHPPPPSPGLPQDPWACLATACSSSLLPRCWPSATACTSRFATVQGLATPARWQQALHGTLRSQSSETLQYAKPRRCVTHFSCGRDHPNGAPQVPARWGWRRFFAEGESWQVLPDEEAWALPVVADRVVLVSTQALAITHQECLWAHLSAACPLTQ